MSKEQVNIVIAGVGGQGTVLTGKLISTAACARGERVLSSETIGMAQRGGSVLGHVRIGEAATSPLVPLGAADVLLAFEPGEALRALPYLAPDGVLICANRAVKPLPAALTNAPYDSATLLAYLQDMLGARLTVVDTAIIDEACGSQKPLNVALLGAACASGALGITLDEARAAIVSRVKERFHDMNFAALDVGAASVAVNGVEE